MCASGQAVTPSPIPKSNTTVLAPSAKSPYKGVNSKPVDKRVLQENWPSIAKDNAFPTANLREESAQNLFNKGLSSLKLRRPDESLVSLRAAEKIEPSRLEIQILIGIALAMLNRTDEAVTVFQSAAKLNPQSAIARSNLCQAMSDSGNFSGAIPECREAVKIAPDSTFYRSQLATLYLRNDRSSEAIQLLLEIYANSQNDRVYLGTLGDSYYTAGEYVRAAEIYEQIALKWPSLGLAYYRLSVVYDYLGRSEETVRAARKFVELEPKSIRAHLNLGERLKATGFFDESIESLKKATALDPESGEAAMMLSDNYSILGDRENTLANLRIAYRRLPRTTELAYRLGEALYDIGSAAEAVPPLEFANKNEPNQPDTMRALGFAYLAIRRYDDGVALIEKANQLFPLPPNIKMDFSYIKERNEELERFDEYLEIAKNNPTAVNVRLRLGQIYRFKNMPVEAEKQYLEVVKIAPNDYRNWSALEGFYAETGQLEKQIDAIRNEIMVSPTHVANMVLADALSKAGKLDEAIDAAKNAVNIKPDSLEARLRLGDLQLKKGRREEALSEFQNGFMLASGDRRPNTRLAWLYIRMGNKEGAFRHYSILKGITPNEVNWLELSLRAHFGTAPE